MRHGELTPVERQVQAQQIRKARCAVCKLRHSEVFKGMWTCQKGLTWPPGRLSRCKRFILDEDV